MLLHAITTFRKQSRIMMEVHDDIIWISFFTGIGLGLFFYVLNLFSSVISLSNSPRCLILVCCLTERSIKSFGLSVEGHILHKDNVNRSSTYWRKLTLNFLPQACFWSYYCCNDCYGCGYPCLYAMKDKISKTLEHQSVLALTKDNNNLCLDAHVTNPFIGYQ